MLNIGSKLGPYEIQAPLGAGGMGEVYRARDTRLGREVAIKILPQHLTDMPDAKQRFEREARAAAALNHRSIVAIYDIGEENGQYFIVMELLDGRALRDRLMAGPLEMDALVDVAIQICDALEAAHAAGIVHRDIKPANIFLTQRGHAKVLDFGLAKLDAHGATGMTQTEVALTPKDAHLTSPGAAVGTIAYMSPEQALGKAVDARTDIFSFGVVLYEMATGKQAFSGPTTAAVFDAILHHEPVAPVRLNSAVPDSLERIINRAIEKDADLRYQHAADLRADLKRLRRDSNLPAPASLAERAASSPPARKPVPTKNESSDSQIVSDVLKRHRVKVIAGAVTLIFVLAAASYGVIELINRRASTTSPGTSFENMQISRLTTDGNVKLAALSPDGRYVAYVAAAGAKCSLWLRQIATDSRVQIVPPSDGTYRGVAFSPDGNFIEFSRYDPLPADWVLYRVPTLGGTPEQLVNDVDSPVTFSPRGERFAFVRLAGDISSIFTANADGSDVRELFTVHLPEYFSREGPSWAPKDGKIAVAAQVISGHWHSELLQIPADGGSPTSVRLPSTPDWFNVDQVAWLPDSSGLLAVAEGSPNSSLSLGQIWELTGTGGSTVRRITNDLNDYSGVSLSKDGNSFVTVQRQITSSIWAGSPGDTSQLRDISTSDGNRDGVGGIGWMPDGKIAYASVEGGYQIWTMNSDGSDARQLTSSPPNGKPHVTPDGHAILFVSGRSGSADVWRMNPDGSDLRQVTHTGSAQDFDISPDGQWLFYTSISRGKCVLFKMPLQGGTPVQLAEMYAPEVTFTVSPNGKQVAFYTYLSDKSTGKDAIEILPLDGGAPVLLKSRLIDFQEPHWSYHWSADGKGLIFNHTENGTSNLWLQPIDSPAPRQLTHFTSQQIFNFAFSHDGRRLAIARGTDSSDAVLVRGFR